MGNDRTYYRIASGGKTEAAIEQFRDTYSATRASWFEFAEQFGAKNIFAGSSLQGIEFKKDSVPVGWSASKLPAGVYKPTRRKVCMDAYREFKALGRLPDGMQLARMIGIDIVFCGSYVSFPSFEKVGDETLLSLHKESEVPEDVEPMKMSEYWQLKENTDAA